MIYFDITDLINHARLSHKVTGIQRVVLEGMKGLRESVVPVFISPFSDQIYICRGLNLDLLHDLSSFEYMWIESELLQHPSFAVTLKYFEMYIKKSNRYTYFKKFFYKFLKVPFIGRLGYHLLLLAIRKKYSLDIKFKYEMIDKFSDGSTFATFGGVWNFQSTYEKIFQKNLEMKKIFFVHDLIPIYSSFVPEELHRMFLQYVPHVLLYADTIIVSSQSIVEDLQKFSKSKNFSLPNVKIINLAHKFQVSSIDNEYIPPLRTRKLDREKYILCVGSIESRKNHTNLLLMWAKYINEPNYNYEKLVIAGKWLWDTHRIQELLTYTGHMNGSVIVIENPDDKELAYLYKKCHFSVYPSHYEGWGLPIGESLSFGKPCIHFDNTSLSEAGCGLSSVVPDLDYKSFYSMIVNLLHNDDLYNRVVSNIICNISLLRSWEDFSNDIQKVFQEEIKVSYGKRQ